MESKTEHNDGGSAADSARIDWLQTKEIVVAGGVWSNGCLERGEELWWDSGDRSDLRAAIDKAMMTERTQPPNGADERPAPARKD